MTLVFGGTTEGKQVATLLDAYNVPYYYSTKTKVSYTGKGISISGEMTTTLLKAFCIEHKITHIINASHPFAIQLHQTIATISLEIPLIRFERKFSPRITNQLVSYIHSFEEVLDHFNKSKYQSLLALSGVQTIGKLKSYWCIHPTWFRILDRDSSRAIAAEANFPSANLLFGYPQSKTEEITLFNRLSPDVIFTKESGNNGKLEEKIQAALSLQIPIVILKKPEISNRYLCIDTIDKLIKLVL